LVECLHLDNDVNLSGRFYTISYTDNSSSPAKDKFDNYKSIEDVFLRIQNATNKEPIILASNCWEDIETQNQNVFTSNQNTVIEYRFQKIIYDYPSLHLDISALSNKSGIFYAGGEIIIQYDSEILGEYLVDDLKVRATQSELLDETRYQLDIFDLNNETIGFNLTSEELTNLMPLSPSERNILAIQLDIEGLNGIANFELDKFQMSAKSYYVERGSKEIKSFDDVIVPNEIPIQNSCFTFVPDMVNAGVGDIVTIFPEQGFDFGDNKGRVFLGNAEDPSTSITFIELDQHHITNWNPNEIRILIPHKNQSNSLPGSGKIELEWTDQNGNLIVVRSKKDLQICYNITNQTCDNIIQDEIIDVYNDNGNGGYTFFLGSKLDAINNAREVIEDAICKWADETGINFELSSTVIQNPMPNPMPNEPDIPVKAQNDQMNIIFLGDMNSGFVINNNDPNFSLPTAETIISKTQAFDENFDPNLPNNCAEKRWSTDIDIIINDKVDIHYSLDDSNVPQEKVDFSSIIIHELGHAGSQHHASYPWTSDPTEQTKTMYWILNKEIKKRYIDKECAVKGSAFILGNSEELMEINILPMTAKECLINSAPITPKLKTNPFTISPSPFQTNFNIIFESIIDQEYIGITIIDIEGKQVLKQDLKVTNKNLNISLKENLPEGIYIALINLNNTLYSQKIIKINP